MTEILHLILIGLTVGLLLAGLVIGTLIVAGKIINALMGFGPR